eukprot:185835-Hanusia_phi.AAC.1
MCIRDRARPPQVAGRGGRASGRARRTAAASPIRPATPSLEPRRLPGQCAAPQDTVRSDGPGRARYCTAAAAGAAGRGAGVVPHGTRRYRVGPLAHWQPGVTQYITVPEI